MKTIFILFCLLFFMSFSPSEKTYNKNKLHNQWKLVYYNSGEGTRLKGKLKDLIYAVENGRPVRVVMEAEYGVFAAEAEYLWVKDGVVHAQNNGSVSAKFQEEELIYQPDSYYWMFIVNTNGIRRTIRWSVGEHENRGEHIENVAIKWYVNY